MYHNSINYVVITFFFFLQLDRALVDVLSYTHFDLITTGKYLAFAAIT